MTWVHHLLPCLLPLLMALLTLFLVMAPFTFHVLGFLPFLMLLIFICSCCLLVRSLVIIVASFLSLTLALFRIVVGGPWLVLATGSVILLVFGILTGCFFLQLPLAASPPPPSMPRLLPPPLQSSSSLSGTIVLVICVGHVCHHLFIVVSLGRFLVIPPSLVWVVSLTSNYSLRGVTPLERLFGRPPQYSHLRVFGCVAFVLLQPRARTKLTTQSI